MADTIEWLETIGKDAKLRHATTEELAHTLALTDASDALKAAAKSGDRSPLSAELGDKPMKSDQGSNGVPCGDEPDPDHEKHVPTHPPKPDKDKTPHHR